MTVVKTFVLFLLLGLSAFGQTPTTGRIAGTVQDQNGDLVAGARVTITNPGNGEKRTATTDSTGNYAFGLLSEGDYRIRIEANGFNIYDAEAIKVRITETTTTNTVLTVVGIAVDQNIVGNLGPLIRTDGPTMGSAFDSRTVAELPLATRNFTQLLGFTAGGSAYLTDSSVVGRNTQNVSVNGSRVSQNNFQINGVDANAGIGFRPISNPAPESISMLSIQTALFDATLGRSGGGNVQVVTMSGTNEFHGAIYVHFRNSALTANNPFLKAVGLPRPVLEREVYGVTMGGAIRQNRAFYFVSFQGTRERNGASRLNSLSLNVLIDPRLTNDRSDATLTNTFGSIHPTSMALLKATLPNGQFVIPTPQAGGRYFGSAISRYREEQFNANFDYRFSRQNLLSAKLFFSNSPETLARDGNVNVPGFPIENTAQNLLVSIQDVNSVRANIFNEARIGYNLVRFSNTTWQPFDSNFGINRSTSSAYPGMPIIRIAANAGGIGFGTLAVRDANGSIPTVSFADTLSITHRGHFLRAGLETRYYANDLTVPIQTRGTINFQSFDNFLSGIVQNAALANGITDRSARTADYIFFFQDDWKLSPKLNLNLGLRYELDLPAYDTRGRMATFDPLLYRPPLSSGNLPDSGIVQAGNTIPQYDLPGVPNVGKRVVNSIDPNNFAPRVGFAYSPSRNDSFVLRGGYGIFYSRLPFSYLFNNIFHPPFYFQGVSTNASNFASFSSPFPTNVPSLNQFPVLVPNSLLVGIAFDRNIRTPYMQQISGGLQYSVSTDVMFEVAYVGTRGLNLFRRVAINQARLATPANPINNTTTNTPGNAQSRAPFQGVIVGGSFTSDQTTARSTYHSLQISLTKRLSRGLQFLASYTFAKSIDTASALGGGAGTDGMLNVGQSLDTDVIIGEQLGSRANRGLSNFDRKHRFVSTFLWELPKPSFVNRWKAGRLFFSGWQISGIVTAMSGLPIDVIDSGAGTFYLGANGGGGRPNFVPGATLAAATSNVPRGYYFNPFAFARPIVLSGQTIPSSNNDAIAGANGTDFGNIGRNILRGPSQFNADLGIIKRFRFSDAKNIEVRGECFNLFNTVNFANPISNLNAVISSGGAIDQITGQIPPGRAGDFGKIISTSNNARVIQIALKFNF